MNHFYVLRSKKDGHLYKGSTSGLTKRLADHKMGRVNATRNRRPLFLIYTEEFSTYKGALAREKYSKTLQGGKELSELIKNL
jgi:predicted GIY-YIG superfamily endonuclease